MTVIKILLASILIYSGFLMGCKWQERESEKELADFWGRYYNIEKEGSFHERYRESEQIL